MQISETDQALWLAGFVGEVSLACVLLKRREYRRFPVFFCWLVLLIALDPILFCITQYASPYTYYRTYPLTQILDFSLQSGILVEIAHSVLRPDQTRISKRLFKLIIALMCVSFFVALIWGLTQSSQNNRLLTSFMRIQNLNFLFAYLRLALFAVVAGFSQMLGITWRNHVIRLAAGLAFYSAVSLIVQLSVSHLSQSNPLAYTRDYSLLNHTQVIAYVCALSFWVWSFVQKDAPRREFTPQMQRILVTISQAARRDRVSLTRSMGHK